MTETSVSSEGGWRRHPALRFVAAAVVVAVLSSIGVFAFRWSNFDDELTARVTRGTLRVHLSESGVMRPSQSITYRSPLSGRDTEIVFLVPEGTLVQKGDLLARLDTTDRERELERAIQSFRQAKVDETIAHLDWQDADANAKALGEGRAALSADEQRLRLRLADKRVERLEAELESLQPLLDKGFITKEELDRVAFELEQATVEAGIARRKTEVYVGSTQPREAQRAERVLAQREAQLENARTKLDAAKSQVSWLNETIQRCRIYARQPGLVIYERYLAASPRRKIRLGDRVTSSQGLVTIPEVQRMVVETSVREGDLHRIAAGQLAEIRLDAFPDARLTGTVQRIGAVGDSGTTLFDEKRFDVLVDVDPADFELRPEMTARVDILVEELPNVLLAPVNALFERDGHIVAHVLTGWGVETRTVELGASNNVYVEVRSGLDDGDRLYLEDLDTAHSPQDVDVPEPARRKRALAEGKQIAPQ